MRPIKFRVWDQKMAKMVHPYAVIFSKEEGERGAYGHSWYEDSKHLWDLDIPWEKKYVVMQYTGLKDKNGKEIWEGDILKGTKYGKQHMEQVEWSHGFDGDGWPMGGYIFEFDEKYEFGDTPVMSMVEVIGNVWENPELCKQ